MFTLSVCETHCNMGQDKGHSHTEKPPPQSLSAQLNEGLLNLGYTVSLAFFISYSPPRQDVLCEITD